MSLPDTPGPALHGPGRLFIGLMSGTSLDGVDGVLMRFPAAGPPLGGNAPSGGSKHDVRSVGAFPADDRPQTLAGVALPMPDGLRAELLALNTAGPDELERAARAANALARLYASAVERLLDETGLPASAVTAIGAHGQTVRHRPDQGFTIQLNAPALLAELTGIDVVADFRSRDVAAGGQGAPLVPPFHAAMFGGPAPRAILNLGGIANLTLLAPGQAPRGFDTGPANVLLDAWCQRHAGQAYDADGRWAASGRADAGLLHALIASEPWLALPPPKSTGRDLFNAAWLDTRLAGWNLPPADVQATLQRFTAQTVADALNASLPAAQEVLVCGGGARNAGLMRDLADALQRPARATDEEGVAAQWMEALAFAWLAQMHVDGLPAGVPEVTGARGPRMLGALYPA
ncbi:MAG TPA: anhydro-N-acetylmuramic acid kinase [Bordetella sp.]